MHPVKIKYANMLLTAPKGWDEAANGPCEALHVRREGRVFVSAWRPDPQELQALQNGAAVVIGAYGGQPPIYVTTETPEAD